jgi:hypothetical protein
MGAETPRQRAGNRSHRRLHLGPKRQQVREKPASMGRLTPTATRKTRFRLLASSIGWGWLPIGYDERFLRCSASRPPFPSFPGASCIHCRDCMQCVASTHAMHCILLGLRCNAAMLQRSVRRAPIGTHRNCGALGGVARLQNAISLFYSALTQNRDIFCQCPARLRYCSMTAISPFNMILRNAAGQWTEKSNSRFLRHHLPIVNPPPRSWRRKFQSFRRPIIMYVAEQTGMEDAQ